MLGSNSKPILLSSFTILVNIDPNFAHFHPFSRVIDKGVPWDAFTVVSMGEGLTDY